jgi:hypothetical protein
VPYDDRESSLQGADYLYEADVKVSAADPLIKAWLTFKANLSDADPGALQLIVTTTSSAAGQVTQDGSTTDGQAVVQFLITAAQSAALSPRDYWFDVKVKTAGTALAYGAGGIWHFWQNNTDAI